MKRKRISLLLFIAANLLFMSIPVITYYILTGMINKGEIVDVKKAISLQTNEFDLNEIEVVEIYGYGIEKEDGINHNHYFINVGNRERNQLKIDTFLVKYKEFKVENKKLTIKLSKPLENENQFVQPVDEEFYIQLNSIPKKIIAYDCSGGFYFHSNNKAETEVILQNANFKFNYHLRDGNAEHFYMENNFNKLSIQASNSVISFDQSVEIQDFFVQLNNSSSMNVTNIIYNNLELQISPESAFYDNFQHLKKSKVIFID